MSYKINLSELLSHFDNKTFDEIKNSEEINKLIKIKEKNTEQFENLFLVTACDTNSNGENYPSLVDNTYYQANGLILEKNTNKIVCACQNKLRELNSETEAKELLIKNKKCKTRVEYCEDGTIIRLYNYNNQWLTATTRCIDARDSYWSSDKTFDTMFWQTFDNNLLDKLDKNFTYIFVLLHEENRIVVKHKLNMLVYVSRIDNTTLIEDYNNIFTNVYNMKRPRFILYIDFDKIKEFYNPMKRGIIIKILDSNTNVWNSYKYDFDEYKYIKQIRGNVPEIRNRYIELYSDLNAQQQLEKYYNEYNFTFSMIKKAIVSLIHEIYKLYIESHIKHSVKIEEDHIYYRTLRQLHAQYKVTNKPIKFMDVQEKIFKMDKNIVRTLLGWEKKIIN